MKKWKLLLILALCTIPLSGCTGETTPKNPVIIDDSPQPSPSSTISKPSSENIINTVIVEDDSQPPMEGMLRSRLTNEWVEEDVYHTRPIAVTIPNESSAIPHYGLSEASVLYEANVEGRMTRMMAIFEDWKDIPKLGNIRSLRTYFGYWSFEWDAFLVHYGGPFYIDDLLALDTTENINGLNASDGKAFSRSTDRKDPHNVYTTGEDILKTINRNGYELTYRGLTEDNHYNFTTKAQPNTLSQYGEDAKNATYIDMSGCYPLTRCYFEYNQEDGLYYRSQHLSGSTDGPHIDGANGEQLKFKNILIQNTYHEELSDGYLVFQCHDTTRDGWYFTNGKGIHVTWKKESDYGATRYYDDYGNEITMNTGKTMVCIVEDGDMFSFH